MKIECQAEQAYRPAVIDGEVDLLFFQFVARTSNCDLVGCEFDSVLLRAPQNIFVQLLIRAGRGKTAARTQLRRHDLHITAQFAVGVSGYKDLPA